MLLAVTRGYFDHLSLTDIVEAKRRVEREVETHLPELCERILAGEELTDADIEAITDRIANLMQADYGNA